MSLPQQSCAANFRPRLLAKQILTLVLVSIWTLSILPPVQVAKLTSVSYEQKQAEDDLGKKCQNIQKFTNISEMIDLTQTLNRVIEYRASNSLPIVPVDEVLNNRLALLSRPLSPSVPWSLGSFGLPRNPMTPCLNQATAINELHDIIRETGNLCLSSHIGKIESYFNRHLRKKIMELDKNPQDPAPTARADELSKKLITAKFFGLYSNQVAFLCKSRLLHWLNEIEVNKLVDEQDYVRAFPWMSKDNMDRCEKMKKKFKKHAKRSRKAASSKKHKHQQVNGNRLDEYDQIELQKIECDLSKVVSEISNIYDLVYLFEKVEQARDARDSTQSVPSHTEKEVKVGCLKKNKKIAKEAAAEDFNPRNALDTMVSKYEREARATMEASCYKLKPFYELTVLSIVRLARLGFNPNHDNFDKACRDQEVIHRWFGIAILCQTILSSNSARDYEKFEEQKNEAYKSSASLEANINSGADENENQRRFEDSDLAKDFIPIDDELWVNKYSKDLFQKMRHGFHRMLKVESNSDRARLRRYIENSFGTILQYTFIVAAWRLIQSLVSNF